MGDPKRNILLNSVAVHRILSRMASEIIERCQGADELVLVGVVRGGDVLAERLAEHLKAVEGLDVPLGKLDITMYRDDIGGAGALPVIRPTDIPFSIDDRSVILVDDVLFTGRTIRAALDALMDFGRPRRVGLAVLIDRGHRELPIQPDYTGHKTRTGRDQRVKVLLGGERDDDVVYLLEPGEVWEENDL